MNPWNVLGTEPTRDPLVIRRTYLSRLLQTHPGEEPDGFHRLRDAYEETLDEILNADTDDEFSLHDLYTDSENDPAPITPTYQEVEIQNSIDPESGQSLKSLEAHAAHWVEQVVERLSFENQQSAAFYLDQILKQPELNDMLTRSIFERLLQKALTLIVPFPTRLANHVFTLFNWHERIRQPHDCYLAAVRYLIEREEAWDRIRKLEELGARRLARKGRVANALLSDYAPMRFRFLALWSKNIVEARAQLQEIEKISPQMVPYILDPRTVEWWQNAVCKPRLFLRHYLAALSIAVVVSLFLVLVDQVLAYEIFNTWLNTVAAGITLMFVLLIFMAIGTRIHRKTGNNASSPGDCGQHADEDWKESLQDYFDNSQVKSQRTRPKNRLYIVSTIFLLGSLAATLFTEGTMMNAFAIIGYTSLLFLFGPTLFFFMNFSAIFVRLIFENQAWFTTMPLATKIQQHTFCLLDVVASFIVINLALQLTCSIFKYPLGITNLRIINQTLYELLIIILVLALHVMIFSIPRI